MAVLVVVVSMVAQAPGIAQYLQSRAPWETKSPLFGDCSYCWFGACLWSRAIPTHSLSHTQHEA